MISKPLMTSLLVLGLFGTGTESTVTVIDKSPHASPIAISGLVTAPNQQAESSSAECKAKLTLRNVSKKAIMVSVVQLTVTGTGYTNWRLTNHEDNFYSDHQFEPGSIVTLEPVQKPKPQRLADGQEKQAPEAIASVQFVQFVDGSTWGDPLVGKEIENMRKEHLQNLKELWHVYQKEGDPEFEIALMKPSNDDAVGVLQAIYREKNNLRIVTDKLGKMLASAEAHNKSMMERSK